MLPCPLNGVGFFDWLFCVSRRAFPPSRSRDVLAADSRRIGEGETRRQAPDTA